jgi:hypothetical protein
MNEVSKKIKFLPTNIPERKWIIKEGVGERTLNSIIKNFKYAGVNSNTKGIKYVPFNLSDDYQFYLSGEYKLYTNRRSALLSKSDYFFLSKENRWLAWSNEWNSWSPQMFIPDYNKQHAPNIQLESTDIYDCIYKLHDMFPQFTEYWDAIGGTKEEYLEDYLKNCESYEILVITAINDTTSVKSVVSYLDNGEIKNVVFDKKLHKIVD